MKRTIASRMYMALLMATVFPSLLALALLYHLLSAHDDLVQSHLQNIMQQKNAITESFLSLLHDRKQLTQMHAQLLGFQIEQRLQNASTLATVKNVLQDVLENTENAAEIALFPMVGVNHGEQRWWDPWDTHRPVPLVRVNRPSLLNSNFLYVMHYHPGNHYNIRIVLTARPNEMNNYRTLAASYEDTGYVLQIYQGIRKYYWTLFFGALFVIVIVSYFVSHSILKGVTRTIRRLATSMRAVSDGNLDVHMEQRSKDDELATLIHDFNAMVYELASNRKRIRYLERMGAWQEVARRLAHEIKNPLTPILLAVQQIHEKAPRDNPKYTKLVDKAVQMVREEVTDLQKLVEAFGALARLPDKQVQDIDVKEFLTELVHLANLTWGEGAVSLVSTPTDVCFRGDRMLMKRALLNVLENAIHATRQSATTDPVQILAVREGHFLMMRITDTGVGVKDPEVVFEPYFTTKIDGTGLGLPLAKKIILDHDGEIIMEARNDAPGTVVSIRLPLQR